VLFTEILLLATKPENLRASWPQRFFLKIKPCYAWVVYSGTLSSLFLNNIPYIALINSTGGLRLLAGMGKAVRHVHVAHKATKRRIMKVPTVPVMPLAAKQLIKYTLFC